MKRNLNKLLVAIGVLFFTFGAQAEVIRIKATLGDKTTTYQIQPESKEYILKAWSTQDPVRSFSIGKKNFDFILSSANQVIRLSKESKASSQKSQCYRSHAEVEVANGSSNASGARICLLVETAESKAILDLLNVIGLTAI